MERQLFGLSFVLAAASIAVEALEDRHRLLADLGEARRDLVDGPTAVLAHLAHLDRLVPHRDAAGVHRVDLAGDLAREIGEEEADHRRDVFGLAHLEAERHLARHARLRDRCDAVGGDAVLVHAGRRAADERHDAALGRGVVRLRDARRERARREADHRAALLLAEDRRRGAEHGEGALEVGLDDRVPLVFRHVEQHALAQDAGDAHDAVDPAEGVDGRLHDRRAALHRRDRVGVGDRPPAGRLLISSTTASATSLVGSLPSIDTP